VEVVVVERMALHTQPVRVVLGVEVTEERKTQHLQLLELQIPEAVVAVAGQMLMVQQVAQA